jgi:DNA-binding transcriptional regulator YhcF (GntR family)
VITLDLSSATPPFEQVRSQIALQIADGRLPAGTRLPPVRRLAGELTLAANTVARAYRDLEIAGLVETRGRGGTIVAPGGDRARQRVQAAAQRYAALAHDVGVDPQEAIQLIRTAFDPAAFDPTTLDPRPSTPRRPGPER